MSILNHLPVETFTCFVAAQKFNYWTFIQKKRARIVFLFRRQNRQSENLQFNLFIELFQVWDTDSRSYIETLFGHQDTVHGIDANTRERAITAGGRDNTIRIFKIPEETQLVYRLSISQ